MVHRCVKHFFGVVFNQQLFFYQIIFKNIYLFVTWFVFIRCKGSNMIFNVIRILFIETHFI